LEIADDGYTRQLGGDRVVHCDILHVRPGNRKATIVADLTDAPHIASGTFDCIICTQTLQFIFDISAAIRTLHRILKPGGVVLTTLPGISQISRYDMERWGEFWRVTTLSARRLFESAFGAQEVQIEVFGNVLTAVAFLQGISAEELSPAELDHHDPDYEVLIAVRARKAGAA
jgi:SAM-dependent methyltransferase